MTDVILIQCVIAFVFMVWGAWYTGVKWHSPFSTYWLKGVFEAPVPLWFAFIIVTGSFFAIWKLYAAHARWRNESSILRKELAELKSKEPKLHGVWNNAQTFWHMGKQGEAPAMQIGGWIDLSSLNTKTCFTFLLRT